MGLISRVRKLENALSKRKQSSGVYFCFKDEKRDFFRIENLGFEGTVDEGEKFMQDLAVGSESVVFLIDDIPQWSD